MQTVFRRTSAALRCYCQTFVFTLVAALLAFELKAEINPQYYAVEASATVQASPAQITLSWAADWNAAGYTISRKAKDGTSWTQLTALAGTATSFTDSSVTVGATYEYQIVKSTSAGYTGAGYVYAGIDAPLAEGRGKVLLLVDNTFTSSLSAELSRLEQDLVGDGWTVARRDVSRNDTPANIKRLIQGEYNADPTNLKSVFLFGHVPVPYSGNFGPDGHADHQGAWAADVYYADMDGTWTDNSVNNNSAEKPWNHNVPGDGKFDQSDLPSSVELQVGRVDLANMTCFANTAPFRSELDLLRQYLNKDHNFRHRLFTVQRRGLICDNFGESSGEAFASSGWRNFASFFGAGNTLAVPGWNYFSTLISQDYLWSYGCGGGSWDTCNGLGSSVDFVTTDIKSVFNMYLGSYFGDWDNESNFLRAPLGSTSYALTSVWSGRPLWFFHHMALGETIGYNTRLSQNNSNGGLYSPQNQGTHNVHVALLGDPTLRMHPVVPPANLSGVMSTTGAALSWSPSVDSDVQGYHVYRSASPKGPFTRLTSAPISETSFTDASVISGTYTYMVRAIKLERSGGGTYFNPSQGIFVTTGDNSGTSSGVPSTPSSLSIMAASSTQLNLSWIDTANNESGFEIERKIGSGGVYSQIATVGPNVSSYADAGLSASTTCFYRVRATGSSGDSGYSNEVGGTTSAPPAPQVTAAAAFVTIDRATQGSWKGVYGGEGYYTISDAASYPAYAQIAASGKGEWTWAWTSSDVRALQKAAGADRLSAGWFSPVNFTIDLNLTDGKAHRLALYCLDWDGSTRAQTIDIIDASNGTVLNSQNLTSFNAGAHLVWDVKGHVQIRFTRAAGANAVLSGIFFGPASSGTPAPSIVSMPTISPNGGTVPSATIVSLASGTSGASIRYTLDGSTPTAASTIYSTPLTLSVSTTVKAKAFKSGMTESPVASAAFTINAPQTSQAQAVFIASDTTTQGNWKGVYGTDGYNVFGDSTNYPNYVQVTPNGQLAHTWSDSASDGRALQRTVGSTRVASCWYNAPGFTTDVNITDGRTHRLALYCLDWDTNARAQTVEVVDASSGTVLNAQTLSNFNGGRYLVWDIKGRVKIRFSKNAGLNAVLSGLFFSTAGIQLSSQTTANSLTAASDVLQIKQTTAATFVDGQIKLRIRGEPGRRFRIEASDDLLHWSELHSVTLSGGAYDFADQSTSNAKFYRALPF